MIRKFLLCAAVCAAFGLGAARSLHAGEGCCGSAKPVTTCGCDTGCCEDNGGLKARLSELFGRLFRKNDCGCCDTCAPAPVCAPAPTCKSCNSCNACNDCERPALFKKKKSFCCPDHSNPYAGTPLDLNAAPAQPAPKAAEPLPAPKAEPKGAASLPLELKVGEAQ